VPKKIFLKIYSQYRNCLSIGVVLIHIQILHHLTMLEILRESSKNKCQQLLMLVSSCSVQIIRIKKIFTWYLG